MSLHLLIMEGVVPQRLILLYLNPLPPTTPDVDDWWSSNLVTPIGLGIVSMMGLIIIGLAVGILVLLVRLDKKLRVIFHFFYIL